MNTRIILSVVIFSSILLTCSVNLFLSQTASAQESPDADDIQGSSLEKFDAGLYAKLQDIESEQGVSGAAGAKDGPYYSLLIIADKGPGASYETASQNKQVIVSLLESYGAKNIHAAGTLSFVTADVPVSKINELSASPAVHIVGDGELGLVASMDIAKQVIKANPQNLRMGNSNTSSYTGEGITVAVLDTGINSSILNSTVIGETYCMQNDACTSTTPPVTSSHGTRVAGIIAAPDIGNYGGIAQDVDLLDIYLETRILTDANPSDSAIIARATEYAHGLQWALDNGADIANISSNASLTNTNSTVSARENFCNRAKSINFVAEEAVDQKMTVVVSAGNNGRTFDDEGNRIAGYKTVAAPACARNVISVGALNDGDGTDFSQFGMYYKTSRGPTSDGLMKPDIVAPGNEVYTLCSDEFAMNDLCKDSKKTITLDNHKFLNDEGTSVAAPMASAAAAIIQEANPSYGPLKTKSALLLGAHWTAPVPCTSVQFEADDSTDKCSNAYRETDPLIANGHGGISIINNVGFGILDIERSLSYTNAEASGHIVNGTAGQLVRDGNKQYSFSLDSVDSDDPVKVILSWFVRPSGTIIQQINTASIPTPNLDMTIMQPDGSVIQANSMMQVNEFAVFNPSQTGTYTVTVFGRAFSSSPNTAFSLASTVPLSEVQNVSPTVILAQQEIAVQSGQTVTLDASQSTDDGTGSLEFSWTQRQNGAPTVSLSGATDSIATFAAPTGSDETNPTLIFDVTVSDGQLSSTGTVTVTVTYPVVYPVTLFSDDFESSLSAWSHVSTSDRWYTGRASPQVSSQHPAANTVMKSANCDDGCVIRTDAPDSPLAHSDVTLSLWRYLSPKVDIGEYLRVEGILNDGTWGTIAEWSADARDDDGAWHAHKFQLGGYDVNDSLDLRITASTSSSSEIIAIDDITITAGGPAPLYDTFESLDSWTGSGWMARTHGEFQHNPESWQSTEMVAGTAGCPSYTCTLESKAVDLSGVTGQTMMLHFWRFIDNALDAGEYLRVEMYDGSSWNTIYNWAANTADFNDDDTWHLESYEIPARYLQSDFKVRFTANPSLASEDVAINSVVIKTVVAQDESDGQPTTSEDILYEFESLSKWTNTGNSNWRAYAASPALPDAPAANTMARSSNCDSFCTMSLASPLDLSGYDSPATLSLWRYVSSGFDFGEYLRVELYDGSSWNTVFDWQASAREDDSRWHLESYELPGKYLSSGFDIRITAKSSSGSEVAMVDKIMISEGAADGGGSNSNSNSGSPTPAAYALYVSSSDTGEIQRYLPDGTFVDDFVRPRAGGLDEPWGLDFGPGGYLFVSDNGRNKIMRYDSSGNPAGSSGNTGAVWADTASRPYGIEWRGDTLYVASYYGIERFDSRGNSLGYYGDATNRPSSSTTPRLFLPYDVSFGGQNMYATVLYPYKILYYNADTGRYSGTISTSSQGVSYNKGLGWDGTGTGSLLSAGDDSGKVIRIDPSTKRPVAAYSSLIDEPYGMTVDSAGIIYVANKDDNNVVKISGTQASALFPSRANGMDDPRDVVMGPAPASASGASGSLAQSAAGGASGASAADTESDTEYNEGPEFGVYLPDGTMTFVIEVGSINGTDTITAASVNATADADPDVAATLSFEIRGTDAEGDAISYALSGAPAFVRLTESVGDDNGAATLEIDIAGVPADVYLFEITASDSYGNDESYDYALVVSGI